MNFLYIKNFNDRILTELRRQEQRTHQQTIRETEVHIKDLNKTLRKASKEEKEDLLIQIQEKQLDLKQAKREYSSIKGNRFIILSSRDALRRKDQIAKQRNKELHERYDYLGTPIPSDERIWSTRNEERLDNMLQSNDALNIAFFLSDQLKAGLECTDKEEMVLGLRQWLALSDSYIEKIPMLKSFNKMIRTHFDGIISRVRYPISNGPLEGINNMIKTVRRQAYGYRDERYFFLKIWERSRRYIKKRSLAASHKKRVDAFASWAQSHSFIP